MSHRIPSHNLKHLNRRAIKEQLDRGWQDSARFAGDCDQDPPTLAY